MSAFKQRKPPFLKHLRQQRKLIPGFFWVNVAPQTLQISLGELSMQEKPALPKILIIKTKKSYKVDWDYQQAPESAALHRHNKELTGFIDGVLHGLGISEKQVSCASGTCGTVNDLDEQTAIKLADILENKLHPLVAREYERLRKEASLPPHLRRDYLEQTDAE